jgi:hypothetical protein
MQRAAIELARGHRRNLARGEIGNESMFFKDGGVAPALRTVELRDHGRAVFHAHLVHAVLVAVERQHAAVGAHADCAERAVERVEHDFRLEPGERHSAVCAVLWIEDVVVHARIVRRAAVKDEGEGSQRGTTRGLQLAHGLDSNCLQCICALDGRTCSPVSIRSSRKKGSVFRCGDAPGSPAYHATMAMSPRMRMTIPRAPCGTAICTDRTMEPICMMFPRFSHSRLYDFMPVKVMIKASLR